VRDADVLQRLEVLGLELPPPPEPLETYVPVTRSGSLAFVAGQIAMVDGRPLHPGRLGEQVTLEMGQASAARAALQSLSALRRHLGSLDRLVRIVQLTVFVAADPEFIEHPKVANGASDTLVEVLGPEGRHARVAVGVASLPLGASVEVTMTAEVTEEEPTSGS
jgi:enamine deaminase RidA (YjgF/YER057c/UK114 family)